MGEYIAKYCVYFLPKKLPSRVTGLDALVVNHRFTAMTDKEVDAQKAAKLEELKLEYKQALEIKLVSAALASESSD